MISRLHKYFSVMFPILPRLLLGFIIFGELHFFVLLNYGVKVFALGIEEVIGAYTIFAFYMWLRIADDFKDYELDKVLFKERPLPGGAVKKEDLVIICSLVQAVAVLLNVFFMNNLWFFLVMYAYGFLMSKWFFKKNKIQSSLPLALITHNPVQIFVNLYVISFTCLKYHLAPFSWITFFVLWTLYFPSLIWEVSRKIRAPRQEDDYTTYSKLFGYKKATKFVMILTIVDIFTNIILVWNLNKVFVLLFVAIALWMSRAFIKFMQNPDQFKIVTKVEMYTYIQESLMLLTVIVYLGVGKI